MGLIVWDSSMSVNVAEIDRQHQKLVAMINELHDAMKAGHGKDALGKILNGLVSYTDSHFKMEEKYFADFKYPDAASHIMEHSTFVKKVSEFRNDFEHGRLTVTIETLHFLRDWLQGHIKGVDKKYSSFFNEKGLY
jgi:hemerythrin